MLRSIVVFLLLVTASAHAQSVVKGPHASRIDSHLTNIVPFGFSGVIAIEKNGELILKKAYGLRDRAAELPLTESTPFIIGSLAKQFTAAAILKLEAEGKLSVNGPLSKFWPDAPEQTRSLTLHQLLSHSSGLPYFSNSSLFEQKPRDEKMRELLRLKPEFTPGSKFNYSNPGYTILAGVIEKASGMSYEKYLNSRIFGPLGMTETGYVSESERWSKLAQPHSYSEGNDEGALSNWQEGAEFVGSGNVVSTINDLYKWEQALKSDKILPEAQRAKLFTAHIPTQGKNGYGYGWNVNKTIRNTRIVAHGGDLGGYNSDFRRYIDEGYTMIFVSNAREGGRGWRDAAMNTASLIVNNTPIPIAPASVKLTNSRLADLIGRYANDSILIALDTSAGLLLATASDARAFAVLAANPDEEAASQTSAVTKQILEDLRKGEFCSLRDNLSPSFPFDDSKQGFAQLVAAGNLGQVKSIEVLGTRITSQMSARTYVTVNFEKGSRSFSLAWMGGKIGGAKDEPVAGLSLPVIATSPNQLVNFDPFTGKALVIELDRDSVKLGALTLRKV